MGVHMVLVQLKMVSVHSEKPKCIEPHPFEVFPELSLKQMQCLFD